MPHDRNYYLSNKSRLRLRGPGPSTGGPDRTVTQSGLEKLDQIHLLGFGPD